MVTVYTKDNCPNCKQTKRMFKFGKIDFKEVNVEKDEDAFNYVKYDLGLKSLPVIEVEGSEPFAYNREKVAEFVKNYK